MGWLLGGQRVCCPRPLKLLGWGEGGCPPPLPTPKVGTYKFAVYLHLATCSNHYEFRHETESEISSRIHEPLKIEERINSQEQNKRKKKKKEESAHAEYTV